MPIVNLPPVMTKMQKLRYLLSSPFRSRPKTPPTVDHLLSNLRMLLMDPSADAQAIVDTLNALPAAINTAISSQVAAAEAAKDAQRATDIAAIATAANNLSAQFPTAGASTILSGGSNDSIDGTGGNDSIPGGAASIDGGAI
jgi:hypothetical protein